MGYGIFIVRDALGSHNLLSWDSKRNIKGEDLVESACDLLGDVLSVVLTSDQIKG